MNSIGLIVKMTDDGLGSVLGEKYQQDIITNGREFNRPSIPCNGRPRL